MTDADADLAHWLLRWAKWMRWNAGVLPDGAPSVASGFENTPSNYAVSEDDLWHIYDCSDMEKIEAVDACIDSLEADLKRAIWWRYGITRVEPPDAVYAFTVAFDQLRVLVLRRVAIA